MNSANVSDKFGVEIEMFDGFTFPIKKDALCLLKIVINLYEQQIWGRSIYQITNVTTIYWSSYWLNYVSELINWAVWLPRCHCSATSRNVNKRLKSVLFVSIGLSYSPLVVRSEFKKEILKYVEGIKSEYTFRFMHFRDTNPQIHSNW